MFLGPSFLIIVNFVFRLEFYILQASFRFRRKEFLQNKRTESVVRIEIDIEFEKLSGTVEE